VFLTYVNRRYYLNKLKGANKVCYRPLVLISDQAFFRMKVPLSLAKKRLIAG